MRLKNSYLTCFSSHIYLFIYSLMNNIKKNNLTINIYADDQLRSSNNNYNNKIRIESSPIQMLYPPLIGSSTIPSVPFCHKQEIQSENIDRKIEAMFE